MDDPIKIIHKFKNNNGRVQYHIHIFVGSIVDESYKAIFNKIKDATLISTLTLLTPKEIKTLSSKYGDYWYEFFFNNYHIKHSKELIKSTPEKTKELQKIFGYEWYEQHINKQRISNVLRNYGYIFKEERERRFLKQIYSKQGTVETTNNIDFTIAGVINTISEEQTEIEGGSKMHTAKDDRKLYGVIGQYDDKKFTMIEQLIDQDTNEINYRFDNGIQAIKEPNVYKYKIGGNNDDDEDDENVIEINEDDDEEVVNQHEMTEEAENQELMNLESEIEQDLDDADIFFGADEVDKNVKQTITEIKHIVGNDEFNDASKKTVPFNTSKDENMFDEDLKNVHHKNFIYHQYIFKDDSIKTIKNKICCAFKNNDKFGDETYIIPPYQYLWSEYMYQNEILQVMIGQKWIVKNDIVKLDVEPNANLNVYEDIRGNLKALRNNIKRQGKIRREDDDNNILSDYNGFYIMNEILMVDLFNEFGLNYNPNIEELKNLSDVYMKIYFPKVRGNYTQNIINYLNKSSPQNEKIMEKNNMKSHYDTCTSVLFLENKIMENVEKVKINDKDSYEKIFGKNLVIQTVVRTYISKETHKINLFYIFDNFVLNEEYPFIQLQMNDNAPRIKYHEKYLLENSRKDIISKWFETTQYGISFKTNISDKNEKNYIAINLNETGRLDYKINWKEEDNYSVEDVSITYIYIKNLIKKINSENEKFGITFDVPTDEDFKFAFMNTIQKIELPDKLVINHNELSDFSRYFYPYVAMVIAPRKRVAKNKKSDDIDEKGKFGTYLRYKRISKFENKNKIEQRIVFFIRNYEYTDQSLSEEISREFNITIEQALSDIENVRATFPNLKKSRKVLKKMENIPKYKPPGIGVDIQGKSRNNYKIRIAGTRDKEQMDKIIVFMNILIYLYIETYLYKKPERQKIKEVLKQLTNVAKRINKVDTIVEHDNSVNAIKIMSTVDKGRIGHKSTDNYDSWSQSCQNSGFETRRRPKQYLTAEDLINNGYKWTDEPYGHYYKKVSVDKFGKTTGKNKKEIILRAISLKLDENNSVHYTCEPSDNGKHMYVGFLTKSKNPNGDTMPCCFIKDQLSSKNSDKKNVYLRSIGQKQNDTQIDKLKGEQLYILQNTNKIQEGRISFLPKYLDVFMNFMLNKQIEVKTNYLTKTSGYFFKYGVNQEELRYLNAISSLFSLSINEIIDKMIKALENDTKNLIFTSLNNGDIRTQFKTIEEYIFYIKHNEFIDFKYINDLLCTPGIIRPNGINIVMFNRKIKLVSTDNLEKRKFKESFYILCNNPENNFYVSDPKRETFFVIKENQNYYPIIYVTKNDVNDKQIEITNSFKYENNPNNIIQHILKYYELNCQQEYYVLVNDNMKGLLNAKQTFNILNELKIKELHPKLQVIDLRFKCKYIITNGGHIIPTIPSGSIYNVTICTDILPYRKNFEQTIAMQNEAYEKSKIMIKPVTVFYTEKKQNEYLVSSILTNGYDTIPIIDSYVSEEQLKKNNLTAQIRPADETIDKEIKKGKENALTDDRVYNMSKFKYETEMYQLFRYHLSYFLNNIEKGKKYKEKIISIMTSSKISKNNKKIEFKKILYQMSNADLYKKFIQLIKTDEVNEIINNVPEEQQGGDDNKWIHILNDDAKINYPQFKQSNIRKLCGNFNEQETCILNQHCTWNANSCNFTVTKEMLVHFINQVIDELSQNKLRADELLHRGDSYKVSDIINTNVYQIRDNEKIIMANNANINKILGDIFGKDNIPIIGKRLNNNEYEIKQYDEMQLQETDKWYFQNILMDNNSIFRAFANAYYWLVHPYSDVPVRNIGYYSELQTTLSNIYKNQVVEWFLDEKNSGNMEDIKKYIKNTNEFAIKLRMNIRNTTGIPELFVLSKINETIIVIYDGDNKVKYIIHPIDGIVFNPDSKTASNKYNNFKKIIHLRLMYGSDLKIIENIDVLYMK